MKPASRPKKRAATKAHEKPIPQNIADLEREVSELNAQFAVAHAEQTAFSTKTHPTSTDPKSFLAWSAQSTKLFDATTKILQRLFACTKLLTELRMQRLSPPKTPEMEIADLTRALAEIGRQIELEDAAFKKNEPVFDVKDAKSTKAWLAYANSSMQRSLELARQQSAIATKLMSMQIKKLTEARGAGQRW